MTVNVTKPAINLREKLSELDKPAGIAGTEILRADTPQEVFNYINAGRRNLIINGGFDVWQRGTSKTSTSSDFYIADRWIDGQSGGTAAASRQELTVAERELIGNGAKYFYRKEVSVGNDACRIQQNIEDVTRFGNTNVTISFWAKGTNPAAGHYAVRPYHYYGSGGSGTWIPSDSDRPKFTVTSDWQYFSFTIFSPSLSGKTIGDGNYFGLLLEQNWGVDFGNSGWTLDITQVQVEYGSVATPFEHRSYGEELALCQRYYEVSGDEDRYSANVVNAQSYYFSKQFNVSKRTSPTITLQTNSVDNLTLAANSATTSEQHAGFSVVATATDGRANVEFQWQADAEL